MKKVTISNKYGQEFGATGEDSEIDQWIEEQKSLNSWGKPERTVREKITLYTDEIIFLDEPYGQSDIVPGYREPLLIQDTETQEVFMEGENQHGIWLIKLKQEYVIEIEDITKNELIKDLSQKIKDYFHEITSHGKIYNSSYRFACDDQAVQRVTSAIVQYQTYGIFTDNWICESMVDVNGNDIPETEKEGMPVNSFNDLKDIGSFIGGFWKDNFSKRTHLLQNLKNQSIQDLQNYNIETKWNEALP